MRKINLFLFALFFIAFALQANATTLYGVLIWNDTCQSSQNYSNYLGNPSTIGGGVCSHPANSGNAFTTTTGNVSDGKFNWTWYCHNCTISPWQNGGNALQTSIKNNSRTNQAWTIGGGTSSGQGAFQNGVGDQCNDYGTLPSNSEITIKLNVTDGFYYFYQDGVLECKLVVGRNTTFIVFHTDNPTVEYSWMAMVNDSAPFTVPDITVPTNVSINLSNPYNLTALDTSIFLFSNASDETGLSAAYFSHNATGRDENTSKVYFAGALTGTVSNTTPLYAPTIYGNESLLMTFDYGNAHDYSGNNIDGTVTGATWNSTGGKYGGAYMFDGVSNNISINNFRDVHPRNAFTLEAWIKTLGKGGTQYQAIIDTSKSGYSGFMMRLGANDNKIRLGFANASLDITTAGDSNLNNNTWYHVAATWDGTKNSNGIKIYVNGILDKQATSTVSGDINSSRVLTIGQELSGGTTFFNGTIDEVRIYNRTLSQSEVTTLYQNTNPLKKNQVINFTVFANDTSNNLAQSSTTVTVQNSVPTILLQNNFTDATTYHGFQVRANVTDDDGFADISSISFGTTAGTCTLLGNSSGGNNLGATLNCTGTALASATLTIGFKDASGSVANTTASANVFPNQNPTACSLNISVGNNRFNTNATIECSGSTDADSDTLTYNFFQNNSLAQNTTSNIFTTRWTADGDYLIAVNVSDGFINSSTVSATASLDTIFPIVTITHPSANSYWSSPIKTNLNVTISCTDTSGIFTHYWNITNVSSGALFRSSTYYNISGLPTTHAIGNHSIALSIMADGNYTFRTYCADSHTLKTIEPIDVVKNVEKKELSFDTATNIKIALKSTEAEKVDNFYTEQKTDRMNFYYILSDTLKLEGKLYIHTFTLSATEKLYYLPTSKFSAHFITGINWIDFELTKGEASYKVTMIDDFNAEIEITTEELELNFESVGELNIVTSAQNFTVDSTNPSIVFNHTTALNNSNLSQNYLFVSVNVTEINTANMTFSLWSNGIINKSVMMTSINATYNFTSLTNGRYAFNVSIFDLAGNSNATETRNATLDTLPPAIAFNHTTQLNNSNVSRSWIFVSVNLTELYLKNISYFLYSNGLLNQSAIMEISNVTNNFTGLADGFYSYNVTAFDHAGNQNTTEARNITLDTAAPSLVYFRDNSSVTQPATINLSISISDATTGIQPTWIYLTNASNFTATSNGTTGGYYLELYAAQSQTLQAQAFAVDYAGNLLQTSNLTLTWNNPLTSTTSDNSVVGGSSTADPYNLGIQQTQLPEAVKVEEIKKEPFRINLPKLKPIHIIFIIATEVVLVVIATSWYYSRKTVRKRYL